MFYLSKDKLIVTDSNKNTVGFIFQKRFTQDDFLLDKSGKYGKVHPLYQDGLSGFELERLSELLQREIK